MCSGLARAVHKERGAAFFFFLSTEMQWNRLVVNLWSKMSLFCSMKEGVSYLFLSATTYLLFCHVQLPPRSAVPRVCCRPSNGRKMQALTAVEWLTAVRYETDERLANGWTDSLPENRLTGLGAGLPLTDFAYCSSQISLSVFTL